MRVCTAMRVCTSKNYLYSQPKEITGEVQSTFKTKVNGGFKSVRRERRAEQQQSLRRVMHQVRTAKQPDQGERRSSGRSSQGVKDDGKGVARHDARRTAALGGSRRQRRQDLARQQVANRREQIVLRIN